MSIHPTFDQPNSRLIFSLSYLSDPDKSSPATRTAETHPFNHTVRRGVEIARLCLTGSPLSHRQKYFYPYQKPPVNPLAQNGRKDSNSMGKNPDSIEYLCPCGISWTRSSLSMFGEVNKRKT